MTSGSKNFIDQPPGQRRWSSSSGRESLGPDEGEELRAGEGRAAGAVAFVRGGAEFGSEDGFETADPVGGVAEERSCCPVGRERPDEHRSFGG
jgi:hypothetical protein